MTSAAAIAGARKGQRLAPGKYLMRCPVPSHGQGKGDRRPSLIVSDAPDSRDGIMATCLAGCDWRDVKAALGIAPDRGGAPRLPVPVTIPTTSDNADTDREKRIAYALRLWGEAEHVKPGTLAWRYFTAHRHLDLTALGDLDHALRWHPGIGAVVALMTDPATGEATGVHRTFLNPDGSKRERKMIGRAGFVRLSDDTEVLEGLGIAEGIEDALAVLLAGWAPVWAALSCGAIARFPVRPGIEALTIFADADEPGQAAARQSLARWHSARREARILPPMDLRHDRTS